MPSLALSFALAAAKRPNISFALTAAKHPNYLCPAYVPFNTFILTPIMKKVNVGTLIRIVYWALGLIFERAERRVFCAPDRFINEAFDSRAIRGKAFG